MFPQAGLPTSDSSDSLARSRRAAASGWASLEVWVMQREENHRSQANDSSTNRMVTSL